MPARNAIADVVVVVAMHSVVCRVELRCTCLLLLFIIMLVISMVISIQEYDANTMHA